jgi:hypothetical protein
MRPNLCDIQFTLFLRDELGQGCRHSNFRDGALSSRGHGSVFHVADTSSAGISLFAKLAKRSDTILHRSGMFGKFPPERNIESSECPGGSSSVRVFVDVGSRK